MKSSSSVAKAVLLAFAVVCLHAPAAQANTRVTDEYIAIDFEAETFVSSDERWVLTVPGTPQTADDPDPNHSDLAIGNAYLEVLPDIRVTHADPTSPPVAFWSNPGIGPTLEYEVDFPEAGRYHVHVRALSTGTEDNGIYVGLNDDWPASGLRLQFCTAGQGWRWSSRQRDSGNNGPCGVEKTIWVTVENPGINTVKFSAREDGFEIDHVMLIKDKSSNTRVCSPINETDIRCVNGSVSGADGAIDMSVELDSSRSNGATGEIFELSASLTNVDRFDDAENVSLSIDAELDSQWELVDADTRCSVQSDELVCDFGTVSPTEPEGQIVVPIRLRALTAGTRTITASVSSSGNDTDTGNDSDTLTLEVERQIEYTTAQTYTTLSSSAVEVLEQIEMRIAVSNTGASVLENAEIELEIPDDVDLVQLPADCYLVTTLRCELGDIDPISTKDVVLELVTEQAATHLLTLTTKSENLEQGSDTRLVSITATPVEEEPEPTPETNPGEVEDSEQSDNGGALGWMLLLMMLSIIVIRGHQIANTQRLARTAVRRKPRN
ncbi:MAG: hypothetical protein AB8B79_07640 [Granulosicoccus sp.]